MESDLDKTLASSRLAEFPLVFWDFDGVIKDSVNIKAAAFEQLFYAYGQKVSDRVRAHHEANQGVSRFEKIPLYLSWAGEPTTPEKVEEFCKQFSKAIFQAVIESPWVPGVREYLLLNFFRQEFVLVTATPYNEIMKILVALNLEHCFRKVYGAPTSKIDALRIALTQLKCNPETALFVGDSEADLVAAQTNKVKFILRRTPFNRLIQARYSGQIIDGLGHE